MLPGRNLAGYVLGYEPYDGREIEEALAELRTLAADLRVVLVAGVARRENGRAFNSALVVDANGSVAGAADKHFLWHFDRQWYAPGERSSRCAPRSARSAALVRDGRISNRARARGSGRQLLVMPTAWVTSGPRSAHLRERASRPVGARSRARERRAVRCSE